MALAQGSPSNVSASSALHSLPANNGAFLTGWASGAIACDGANVVDVLVSVKLQRANANLATGVINVYVIAAQDNAPTWPDIFSSGTEGTEGAATIHSTLMNTTIMTLLGSIPLDTAGGNLPYGFSQRSIAQLFGGVLPPSDILLWITSNGSSGTNAVLAGTSTITVTPVLDT